MVIITSLLLTEVMKTLLISGTDTDAGKTILTACLAAYWQTYCQKKSLGIMKLIQTGAGEEENTSQKGAPLRGSLRDRQLYRQLFAERQSTKIVVPQCFSLPLAPPIAAEKEGREIELEKVWQVLSSLVQEQDFVLVEALGGLGSPVTRELTVADLAGDWRLNTVLTVPVKLGAIGQTVANVALARQSGIALKGIVLSCIEPISEEQLTDWAPIDLIESLTKIPVLGVIPHLEAPTNLEKLALVASNLYLEMILPF